MKIRENQDGDGVIVVDFLVVVLSVFVDVDVVVDDFPVVVLSFIVDVAVVVDGFHPLVVVDSFSYCYVINIIVFVLLIESIEKLCSTVSVVNISRVKKEKP